MDYLAIFFFPYLGLGLFAGLGVTSIHTRHAFSLKGIAILAGCHIVLAVGGLVLAGTSIKTDGLRSKLSPAGWVFGFGLAYVVGFVTAFFI
jgi:hypothetical protein